MHFTRKFAPVFLGREPDVRGILDRIRLPEGRFMVISGDSGTGKSSLVDAGVLPRVEEAGLSGYARCLCRRIVPSQGNHPFDALMRVLHADAVDAGLDPYRLAEELLARPETFIENVRMIISKSASADALVVFLDQMEELFTSRGQAQAYEQTDAFLRALFRAAKESPLRVISTIRSDFLHHCHRHPDLLQVLRGAGHYPLGRLEQFMMRDMIVKPAACAGLKIQETLVRRLIQETGSGPGNLPLLAFVLQRLFEQREGDTLSEAAYDAFGGVGGSIAGHIEAVEERLLREVADDALDRLPRIFQHLLVVTVEGQPTRRRAVKATFSGDLLPIVDLLIRERLLSTEGEGEASTVSVAHEKLFDAWPALARWIAENRDDLLVVRQAEIESRDWVSHAYDIRYLWHVDRLRRLWEIIRRMGDKGVDPSVKQYASPQDNLIVLLQNDALSHRERLRIGEYLTELGDPRPGIGLTAEGVPDIDWVEITGGRVELEGVKGAFEVKPFSIARYPVTNIQYQAFVEAKDGYRNVTWWKGIMRWNQKPESHRWGEANVPRDTVSWFEAVAFCRWLTNKYRDLSILEKGREIRLPTEWEWQQAATGGDPGNVYPWGPEWDASRCNTAESGLNRTTVVGLYPNGTWPRGPLDMAGNIEEWCLNKFESPTGAEMVLIDASGDDRRVLRGGSSGNHRLYARCGYRSRFFPGFRYYSIGFRCART